MEQMKCQSCGAPLTPTANGDYRCEYCGSLYRIERPSFHPEVIKYIEINPPAAVALGAEVVIDDCIMRSARAAGREDDLSKHSIERLTHELAKGLAAYMRLDTNEDPLLQGTIIRGTVRVVPPDYRF